MSSVENAQTFKCCPKFKERSNVISVPKRRGWKAAFHHGSELNFFFGLEHVANGCEAEKKTLWLYRSQLVFNLRSDVLVTFRMANFLFLIAQAFSHWNVYGCTKATQIHRYKCLNQSQKSLVFKARARVRFYQRSTRSDVTNACNHDDEKEQFINNRFTRLFCK